MAVKQVFNTSAELDFPNVLPTLDLDFANSKTLDPRITFTRSSGGSYVGADGLIKYAGVNEARFDHDPSTGESLGLLIEEARTNLLLRSEEFNSSSFNVKANISVSTNQVIAPDGTLTADKITENTNNSEHYIEQNFSPGFSGTVTHSVFLKAGERTQVVIRPVHVGESFTTSSCTIDLLNGTIISSGLISSSRIEPFPNGWYRVSVTFTLTGVNTLYGFRLHIKSSSVSLTYLGDGASGFYAWGAQVEAGAFPTSYIPTQASTRTRAVDIAQITGKNFSDFFNPTEGAVFVDFKTTGVGIVLNIDNGGFPNRIQFSNTSGIAYVRDSTIIINNSHPSTPSGLNFKYATSYSDNKYIITRNGISISYPLTTEFRGGPPIGLANMRLGSYHGIAAKHNGFIRRVIYYPKFLSKEQHQALTS
jgi:hypothetical protein